MTPPRRSPRLRKIAGSSAVSDKGLKRCRPDESTGPGKRRKKSNINFSQNAKVSQVQKHRQLNSDTSSVKLKIERVTSAPECAEFPLAQHAIVPEQFDILRFLGNGACGHVYLVRMKGTELLFAMKIADKKSQHGRVKRVLTEREILATVNHPLIVNMYATFQDTQNLYFVMEYCSGGTLRSILRKQPHRRVNEDAARFYAAETLVALEYLHHLGYLYRDLKTENILIRADGHIALADFDLCKVAKVKYPRVIKTQRSMYGRFKSKIGKKRKKRAAMSNTMVSGFGIINDKVPNSFVGTLSYLSPEVIKRDHQSSAVDWWSLGILIYEMITARTPFGGRNKDAIYRNICNQKLEWPNDVIISRNAKALIMGLLEREPSKRLGSKYCALDIKKSKWFRNVNFETIRNEAPPIIPKVESPDSLHRKLHKEPLEDLQSPNPEELKNDPFNGFDIRKDTFLRKRKY